MRVIIELDRENSAAVTSQIAAAAPSETASAINAGGPPATVLQEFGVTSETAPDTFNAGPPSAELVAAIAQAQPSSTDRSGAVDGGGAPL
jgi:hypothetical protein